MVDVFQSITKIFKHNDDGHIFLQAHVQQTWSNIYDLEFPREINKRTARTESIWYGIRYLGNDARRSARNLVSKSVTEPNWRSDISPSISGGADIGELKNIQSKGAKMSES